MSNFSPAAYAAATVAILKLWNLHISSIFNVGASRVVVQVIKSKSVRLGKEDMLSVYVLYGMHVITRLFW